MPEFNILIIDDNKDLASGLAVILQTEGHNADTAFNGKDGTNMFYNKPYDLVLLDAKMPDANGIALSHKFAQDRPGCRIIIITGFRIEQLITESLKDCHVSVLHQPVDSHHLQECINKSIKNNIILLPGTAEDYSNQLSSMLHENNIDHILLNNSSDIDTIKNHNEYGAIISNIRKPISSQLNTFIELKNRDIKLPFIIVLPLNSETGKTNNLRDIEITGCLFKPFEPVVLLKAIENMIISRAKASNEC